MLKNLTISGSPGTTYDFLQSWNLGYKLFDEFDGDNLSHTDSLSVLQVHDGGAKFHPMTRTDLAQAVRAYTRETNLFHGRTYRVYARYSRIDGSSKRRFKCLEFIFNEALTGPSGPAVKLGTVEL